MPSNRAVRAALLLGRVSSRPGAGRLGPVALGIAAVLALSAVSPSPTRVAPPPSAHHAPGHPSAPRRVEFAAPALPAAVSAPAPAPPALLAQGPLAPHEIFGFAPYWTLDRAQGFDLRALSTVAYFGLDVNPDGGLSHSDAGWNGYQSQALADLVTAAHRNRVRMVLTIKAFDADVLHRLATDPAVPGRLAAETVQAMRDKNFDGLNIDLEGQGPQERATLATLVRSLAGAVHAANPAWQVTVDTYATSATDGAGWFDVAAMAPAVDAFFVMAYDMYQHDNASPNSPLQNSPTSVSSAGAAYAALVGRNKVIMGAPFYGYDWETQDNQPASHAARQPPAPVVYSAIRDAGRPEYWDADHLVPWTAYQDGGKWHEVYYDNPTSLALKARAAAALHLLGIGVWALGMDGNDPAMMSALLGRARPLKSAPGPAPSTGPAGQSAPAATAPAGTPTRPPAPRPTPRPSGSPSPSPSPSGGVPLPGLSPPPKPGGSP